MLVFTPVMDKLTKIIILCLVVKVTEVFGGICSNGANCIALTECKGIQNGIHRGEQQFVNLFTQLRCGLNDTNGDLMVCCPPDLLNTPATNTKSDDVIKSLLPNETVCGIYSTDRLLFGGSGTLLDDHSWLALIRYNKTRGSGFHCGGVLISSRYVLTAAHCVKGADLPADWIVSQVRLGEWNTSSEFDCDLVECAQPVIDVDVEEIIPHSQYKTNDSHQHNDIALLRLARDVPFNDFINPICLPYNTALRNNITFEGQTAEVAGWGIHGHKSSSDIKLRGNIAVLEQSECRNIYRQARRNIVESQLCARRNEEMVACHGDSGGPLMAQPNYLHNWMLVGLDSYGPMPCVLIGWPRVYTRVTSYLDWIINNMRR